MRIDQLMQTRRPYLTDGGMETFMIFDQGFELPCFSAASLLESPEGRAALEAYFERFIDLARANGRGFLMDTPTWRSGLAWAEALGLSETEQLAVNQTAVAFTAAIRAQHEEAGSPIVLNGVIGPAGDAYAPDTALTAEAAQMMHAPQVRALAQAGVDMISAMTLTHAGEALGLVRAAQKEDVPIAISFTVETDGRLPSGQPLNEAMAEVDAGSEAYALYFMINCAHPDHFIMTVDTDEAWIERIGGLRTNASRLSHAELDAAEELDDGDPIELGALHEPLLRMLPNIRVLGGCCGTDHRHVGCIAAQSDLRDVA